MVQLPSSSLITPRDASCHCVQCGKGRFQGSLQPTSAHQPLPSEQLTQLQRGTRKNCAFLTRATTTLPPFPQRAFVDFVVFLENSILVNKAENFFHINSKAEFFKLSIFKNQWVFFFCLLNPLSIDKWSTVHDHFPAHIACSISPGSKRVYISAQLDVTHWIFTWVSGQVRPWWKNISELIVSLTMLILMLV